MLTNSINKFIQKSFLTTSLKVVQSASWIILAILAFPSFLIDGKHSCFFAKKAVAIWNKNESLTTTKVNQVVSSISSKENSFLEILDQWTKEDPIRTKAKQRILEFFSSKETRLNLSSLGLTSLPDIFHFEPFANKLKHLNLNDNLLKSLPESFGNLQALTILNLIKNPLKSLPESFGNLQALTDLYLIGCDSLESFPKSFSNLQALTNLYLIGCGSLERLQESFDNLVSVYR